MDQTKIDDLFVAVGFGDTKSVKELLNAGIDPDIEDVLGSPLLQQAVAWGKFDIVEMLVMRGAEVDIRDTSDATPLMYAGNVDIADLLIENKADITAQDERGCTPFHCACAGEHMEVAERLLIEKIKAHKLNKTKSAKI